MKIRTSNRAGISRSRLAVASSAVVLAQLGCAAPAPPTIQTTILAPASGDAAWEPSIAIDPAKPNRILVGAMSGSPEGRGGARWIWVWHSTDGGQTWADGHLDPHLSGEPEPTAAADVNVRFARDGARLVASMADAAPALGGTYVSRAEGDTAPFVAAQAYRNVRDSVTQMTLLYDKPWMVVDHGERSPNRGAVYMTNGGLLMDPGPAGIGLGFKGPLRTRLMFTRSRDDGRSFSPPALVADSSFSGGLAVGGDGTLSIAYARVVTREGDTDTLLVRRSSNGGDTFGPAEIITVMTGDTLAEMPVLASRPNGDLLDCWAQGVRTGDQANQVRCAVRSAATGAWRRVAGLDATFGAGVEPAWPAVVGTERGWYLLVYLVSGTRTEVVLFRSSDGRAFTKVATVATADGIGHDNFCIARGALSRCQKPGVFSIGEYTGFEAGGGRLAAAYVLPRTPGAAKPTAAIYVTTLAEPAP